MGKNQAGLVAGATAAAAAVLGVTAVVGTAMVVRHRRAGKAEAAAEQHQHAVQQEQQRQRSPSPSSDTGEEGSFSWLAQADFQRFPEGQAGIFVLHDLDRSPQGKLGGAGVLRCSDTGSSVPVETLLDVPGLVLYSIETVEEELLLVFLQVPSVPELFDTPFLDRGVRALAKIDSKVYVARLDAIEGLPDFVPSHDLPPSEQARYSFVWNTGRCGSTLMHKMLQKVGVMSFSEPYWLERISEMPLQGRDHDVMGRVFGACAAMDVLLARNSFPAHRPVFGAASTLGSAHVSFNLKGGCMAMEPVMKALPHARHLLMYRDMRKVVESFGSIFMKPPPSLLDKFVAMFTLSRKKSEPTKPAASPLAKESMGSPILLSMAVEQALVSGDIIRPSNPISNRLSISWMQTLCLWKELMETGVVKDGGTSSLRMEDFNKKDPELIETILHFVLGKEVEVGEDAILVALEAFNRHSQAGDIMSRSSHMSGSGKARFLSPSDVREIEAVAAAVPAIGSPDYILPDSLGAPTTTSERVQ